MSRQRKQGELFGKQKLEYGGERIKGRRKVARPFDSRHAVHATFRASGAKAGSALSMHDRRHKGLVYLEAFRIAEESRVKLYRFVNVGNHLHVVLKAPNRAAFQRFLRVFAGRIAMLVTGAKKGRPHRKLLRGVARDGGRSLRVNGGDRIERERARFWSDPVYTKIISWGRQWVRLDKYMEKNLAEAEGVGALLVAPGFRIVAQQLPRLNP